MKIIQLTAENVKKIKVVDITPTGDLVQVTGPNGSGKTSVLDSIWWALGGKKQIQPVPLRKGTEQGRVRLDLGRITVERIFKKDGTSTVTVRPNGEVEGMPGKKHQPLSSPQDVLDELIGSLSFDPLAFARQSPREQYETLRLVAKVDVDFEALQKATDVDFKKRTEKNRDVKELTARAAGFSFTLPASDAEVDVKALLEKMQSAIQHNSDVDRKAERRTEAANHLAAGRKHIAATEATRPSMIHDWEADLEKQIKALRVAHDQRVRDWDAELDARRKAGDDLEAKLNTAAPLPGKIDADSIREAIAAAQVANGEFKRRAEQADLIRKAKDAQAEADALTAAIEEREKTKILALQSAKMPVEGLSLADGYVKFNGLPFEQSSDAECLEVSTAIAMDQNSKLRVIRIREGSLLDENGVKIIARLAKERDYQVWMEKVDNSGKIGIVMEDGQVAFDHQAAVASEVQE